jgi:AbrB family looped-hinge helix DNA binding protein
MKAKAKKDRMVSTLKDKKSATGSFVGGNPESSKGATWVAHRSKGGVHTATVTSKGQITVPKRIRMHLQVGKGDRIEFLIGPDGKVTLMPATTDVKKLKGIVGRPDKPVTVEDMNRVIEAEGGKRY